MLAAAITTSQGEQTPSECVVWMWRSAAGGRGGRGDGGVGRFKVRGRAVPGLWLRFFTLVDEQRETVALLGAKGGRPVLAEAGEADRQTVSLQAIDPPPRSAVGGKAVGP